MVLADFCRSGRASRDAGQAGRELALRCRHRVGSDPGERVAIGESISDDTPDVPPESADLKGRLRSAMAESVGGLEANHVEVT